jgi:lipopolysaccharide transport system permease protein
MNDTAYGNFKAATAGDRKPVSIIGAQGPGSLAYLKRVWRNRRLMGALCFNFLAVTYNATILGWWWLIIRTTLPTLGMIAIFQHVKSLQPQALPYPLHVISGMTLWTLLGMSLTRGTRCLRMSRKLHMRIGFPKILVPAASLALPATYATSFFLVLLAGIAYYYAVYHELYLAPLWRIILFPVPVLLIMLFTIGILSVTSVLFLFARDIRMLFIHLVQLWFYFTPIYYPIDILPEGWRIAMMYLNPMVALIEFARWSLLGTGTLDLLALLTSATACLVVFWLGMRFMARAEVALSIVRVT